MIRMDCPAQVVGVGIDTARYGHHVTFLRQDLSLARKPFEFSESGAGYAKLKQALEELDARLDHPQFHIRVDAAGQYASNLLALLHDLPFDKVISIGEPKRNKDYRNVHFPKRKADAVESQACARFAVVERPKSLPAAAPEFRQLRELLSALQSQTKRTTRLLNQLHNRLARAFPELATLVKDISTASILALLQKYPTAERISAARLASLEAIPYLKPETAKLIHQAAKQSVASLRGAVVEEMIRQLVQEVQQSQRAEKRLGELMKQAYDALPAGNHRLIESIPGIGKQVAAALVASIVDIERFKSADSLVNYFGTFPEEESSGFDRLGRPKTDKKMRMCQKGNDVVRRLLYMACLTGLQRNPAIAALYVRKVAENKAKNVALGHCMRKMLHLVFAIWKTGTPFDPHHYPWQQPAHLPQQDAPPAEPLKKSCGPQRAKPQSDSGHRSNH